MRLRGTMGVALIEVVIALTILVVTLTLIIGGLNSITRLASVSEQRELAAIRLGSVLEELRQWNRQELLTASPGSLPVAEGNETIQVECQDGTGQFVSLPLDTSGLSSAPNPLTVRVTLTRSDVRGTKLRVMSGFLCLR
ncbi:MAG: hypothetical protein HY706_07250 [Candidatus Hydrogenedentes bacterium]|nr:hypothetical protein [Candidatus Hydrogenedentota bacterium]